MRHRHAFTLIELLVVVSIIVLLIALLMPALSKSRNAARDMMCMSNLRQLGTYIQVYHQDHKGHLPPNDSALPHRYNAWNKLDLVSRYMGVREYDPGDFTVWRSIFACPSVNDGRMTYTMNFYLRSPVTPALKAADSKFNNPLLHTRPTRLVTIADGVLQFHEGRTSFGTRWNSDGVDYRHPRDTRDHRQGKANFLLFDGHVERRNWAQVTLPNFGTGDLLWY